ncbi:4Fe-4S single cluster domain-containing protein [Butyrivibrio sp.]|uniref:4Fe-4S single cluster domain-containing protein n=1 Tax=Butyrivibrio sp. TaxID=28121 RepID=UPI0025BDA9DE|nr:4Fe-4S single cluster domain-containing protein [Butyrivibrio sp.]MBE5838435.1 radical SAM protein [Butyrivibrio sp.]
MKTNDEYLSLNRLYYPVKTLGPGDRVGIWTTGCIRNCRGCISPELQAYDLSKEVLVNDVLRMIATIKSPIDGFTISGGEPFYKPKAMRILIDSLFERCDDIIIFTGYTLDELKELKNEDINSTLEKCAVLVDGPFIKELNDGKGLRGSSNQKCHVFRHHDKYSDIEVEGRQLQTVVYDGKVLNIGIP